MKKLFLLALIVLMVCCHLFADDVKETVNATLSLNLGEQKSVIHAGFLTSAPTNGYEGITSSLESVAALTIEEESETPFTTSASSFYVFWYINALKGENGSSLSLNFTRLVGKTRTEDTLGYTLNGSDLAQTGKIVVEAASKSITANDTDGDTIPLIDSNHGTGLSRGYIKFTIPAFDYSMVSAQTYNASLSLTITAP